MDILKNRPPFLSILLGSEHFKRQKTSFLEALWKIQPRDLRSQKKKTQNLKTILWTIRGSIKKLKKLDSNWLNFLRSESIPIQTFWQKYWVFFLLDIPFARGYEEPKWQKMAIFRKKICQSAHNEAFSWKKFHEKLISGKHKLWKMYFAKNLYITGSKRSFFNT